MVKKNISNSFLKKTSKSLFLFGYEKYFNFFRNLYENKNLPHSIILTGPKGSGKSTFVYHFINYIFSKSQTDSYDLLNFKVNEANKNYKLLENNLHTNFFLLDNENFATEIKIEQVRKLHKFLNSSTYSKDIKVVLIDNAETLNKNSVNSLLKAIEEPKKNTFFFIMHSSSYKILETLKSRCVEFKIHFSFEEKKKIFKDIHSNLFSDNYSDDFIKDFLYIDSPGNVIKYFLELSKLESNNNLEYIYYFIKKYKVNKDSETLSFLLLFINNYYKNLLLNINNNNHNNYLNNHSKVIRFIHDMKNFSLNQKNVLNSIEYILENEKR